MAIGAFEGLYDYAEGHSAKHAVVHGAVTGAVTYVGGKVLGFVGGRVAGSQLGKAVATKVGQVFGRAGVPQAAEAASGKIITVFHKGILNRGKVIARINPFSTGVSSAEVDSVIPGSAPIHEFNIPEEIFHQWDIKRWVKSATTSMNGHTLKEFQFSRQAQEILEQYRVKK